MGSGRRANELSARANPTEMVPDSSLSSAMFSRLSHFTKKCLPKFTMKKAPHLSPLVVLACLVVLGQPAAILANDPCATELEALEECSDAHSNLAPIDYCLGSPLFPTENVTCATFVSGVCSWQSRTIQCEPCRESLTALLSCYTSVAPDQLYGVSFADDTSAKGDCPAQFPCSGSSPGLRRSPVVSFLGAALGLLWACWH